MARVLIMHGWKNRRQENTWHRILTAALRKQGHQVLYPQFPNTDAPHHDDWQELLLAELALLEEAGEGEKIVIGHSLGCVNFIRAAVDGKISNPVDRLLLVAPADPNLLDEVPGFKVDLAKSATKAALAEAVKSLTIVGSDADPWSPDGVQETFGKHLGVEAIIIEGAQHFRADEGWGQWQGLLDWVNDPAADITVR